MKTKLLKKLRNKFYIIYIPSKKTYDIEESGFPVHCNILSILTAKRKLKVYMLDHAWKKYSKYCKQIKITF